MLILYIREIFMFGKADNSIYAKRHKNREKQYREVYGQASNARIYQDYGSGSKSDRIIEGQEEDRRAAKNAQAREQRRLERLKRDRADTQLITRFFKKDFQKKADGSQGLLRGAPVANAQPIAPVNVAAEAPRARVVNR